MNTESISFEGISFNVAANAKKSFDEFYAHEKHHGLTREQMQEAHNLIKGVKTEKPKTTIPAADVTGTIK